MKDIIGKRNGKLVVEERAGKIGTVQLLKCLCDCGNHTIVRYPNFVSGITTSCGCVKKQKTSERFLKDLTGMIFGDLTVERRFSDIGGKKVKWLCRCSCGSYCVVQGSNLKSGNSTSCGCKRASLNESIIISILRKEKIIFEKEYKFPDLKSTKNRPLRFDFKIYTVDGFFLLEYQGIQHFREQDWTPIGRTSRLYTDKMKVDYCEKNNIELCFITYEEDTESKLWNILEHHNVLYANSVPSSVKTEKV